MWCWHCLKWKKWGGYDDEQRYLVTANQVMVRLARGDSVFMMRRSDYSGTLGHASATAYYDQISNQRQYTTEQGHTYTVIDTVREQDRTGIHAAIAVNTYEIIVDFYGYTQEAAYQILEQMDLSVYY